VESALGDAGDLPPGGNKFTLILQAYKQEIRIDYI